MSDKPNNNVLVLGSTMAAAEVAATVSKAGYPVLWATENSELKTETPVEMMTGASISEVKGYVGDFQVSFRQSGETVEKAFGSIVLTSDLETCDLKKVYGLEGTKNVQALSELAEGLKKGDLNISGKRLAFLYGLKRESNAAEFSQLLDTVKKLKALDNQVFVFIDNIKLAALDLDQKFHEAREQGVVFLKSPEDPEFTETGNTIRIVFKDSALLRKVELEADLVVVDSDYQASATHQKLSEQLGVLLSPNSFLQAENVHNLTVRSNRKGVFVVGDARQIQSPADNLADLDNVVFELDKLFKLPTEAVVDFAEVDPEKCVICLTCLRSCQHKAVTWVDGKAKILEQACFACGICASECPMNAIQVKSYTDEALVEKITAAAGKSNRLVALCCKNSALEAQKVSQKLGLELSSNLEIIELPCAGKLDMELVLEAVTKGADGVLILGCHPGNCKSEKGSIFAGQRVTEVRKMLESVGIDKERVQFGTLAANMGSTFHKLVQQMEKTIK